MRAADRLPEEFVARWEATLNGATFFGRMIVNLEHRELLAAVAFLADDLRKSKERERNAALHEFDAHRHYRKNGPDRRQIAYYWPEVDRRNADREARRTIDRVIQPVKKGPL